MSATIYSCAPLKIGTAAIPVKNIRLDHGTGEELFKHSGNISTTAVVVTGADPRVRFSCPLRTALDTFGLAPLKSTTYELYLTKFSDLIKASSGHYKLSLAASVDCFTSIIGWSIQARGVVMAECETVFRAAAPATHPLVPGASATIPSISSTPKLHTLGPVAVNGTTIPGLRGNEGQLNTSLEPQQNDGWLYPSDFARLGFDPRITLSHVDPAALIAVSGLVGAGVGSSLQCYFRQFDETSGVVDTGATGLRLSMAIGHLRPVSLEAETGSVATEGLEAIAISSDGMTAPVVYTADITVP